MMINTDMICSSLVIHHHPSPPHVIIIIKLHHHHHPHQLCFINTIRQGASALSRSFRMLSYEDFKDGVRMANRSITAIKMIAEEQSELLNAISDDDGDGDGDADGDGDDGDRINDGAVRDDVMAPMLEFNNNDNNNIHTASMLHGRSHHHRNNHQRISSTAGINLSRPSTSLDASSAQEQREATIMMTIASDDDRGSTVAATVADDDVGDDVGDDYDTPSIYEYLQPKPKETSVVEQQQQMSTTAKSRNPFYRPNTTAATDPHPNLTDPSLIKELGPPLKSMIINNTVE